MSEEIKIIGKSPPTKRLVDFIKKASKTDVNILLLGETGVGKELAARWIHLYSSRRDKPFIKINCANLMESLLESELFGYKKGAYTGAITDKPGLLETANGGTFFLDEITDITPYLQAKFLTIIEEKELRRLGENKTRKIMH
jgi:transcriptional regulator with PAS, ATPase and Fis domain